MPYVMRANKGKIQVVNPLTGDVKGTHNTKRQALAQMRALYANVPDAMQKRKGNIPSNPQLWMQAKNMAARKFAVYPSAYANAWAARWYKEHGGTWRKGDTGEVKLQKDLREWFDEQWVDISKPIRENGKIVGYEQCGRREATADEGGYPKCLPKAKAMKLSEEERQTLIRRKRRAGEPTDGKPVMTSNTLKASLNTLLEKVQRQYQIEEWVDITKPVRDVAGVLVGYQPCAPKQEGGYPMRRSFALRLTDDERQKLIRHRFGHMTDDDGIPMKEKPKQAEMKKYGRYRRGRHGNTHL